MPETFPTYTVTSKIIINLSKKFEILFPFPMKRFVKCFFELLTENFSAWRETGHKKGHKTRLWTVRSRFRGQVV